jgi:hypothetical protein
VSQAANGRRKRLPHSAGEVFVHSHLRVVGQALSPASLAVFLTGCAYVGPPLAPTLDIPSRITDLTVAEYADKIVAQFTIPPLTTEGLPLKSVRSVELRVVVDPNTTKSINVPATEPGVLRPEIPAAEWIGKTVTIDVRAVGPKGKTSGWSIPRTLPLQPPLERPTELTPKNLEKGVGLTWHGAGAHYRIFRVTAEEKPEMIGESDRPEYLDTTTVFDTLYKYFVQATAGELQQSDISEVKEITPKDEFAPAIPTGLTATPGVNAIELAWDRNTESDFKGYNVFRSVEGGPFEKIASLIEAPTYSDHQVEVGKKYRYAVSAVDLTGNESQRSALQEVSAQ